MPGEKAGDMVFENALLFLRDSLVVRELITATKRGDPGRIMLNLKVLALSFRGSGRVQYTFEALSMIHNVQVVWPSPLRDLALRNWLLNPTGKVDSWVPLDLIQEHANFWIKTVYNATGSGASWSWLAAISPCTEALRNLVRDLSGTLGTYLGTKHTSPDISLDVDKLIRNLDNHNVYRLRPGRTFNGKDSPATDMQSLGMQKLMDGRNSGINEYNRQFKSMQDAYRVPPVSQTIPHPSLPRRPPGGTGSPISGLSSPRTETRNESEGGSDNEARSHNALLDDPDSASEDGSIEPIEGDNVEDTQMDDFEWSPQDEESWLDDLAIFQD
ncbi:hypothetical protein FRC11_001899 [Ceratobasidium sp. 423]|nr:hypothetical protein FRC11_001899 [Ceratobasidium sp. 423]